MSHVTLYRKYRPNDFSEILGQQHITESLQSIITSGNIAHAYMFAGSRGTGKTSTARVFARALGTADVDIHEIDAASQRRVEDMREFITEVGTRPMMSQYKVYIFDEVHMLTKESANTFLKTLEEPPAHVIFILCTTDLDKVLDTIISRCQTHIFKQPDIETITNMLISGAVSEGYTLEKPAAQLIATYARGAFRDGWGYLEKILTHATPGQTISDELVRGVLDTGAKPSLLILQALHEKNLPSILGILHETEISGGDTVMLLDTIIHHIRIVMMMRFAPAVATDMTAHMDETTRQVLTSYASEQKNIFNSGVLLELLQAKHLTERSGAIAAELAFIDILSKLEQ